MGDLTTKPTDELIAEYADNERKLNDLRPDEWTADENMKASDLLRQRTALRTELERRKAGLEAAMATMENIMLANKNAARDVALCRPARLLERQTCMEPSPYCGDGDDGQGNYG